MMVRIGITVGEKTQTIDIDSPDSVDVLKREIFRLLETQRFILIPYTKAIYRCDIVDRVTVQEW